MTETNRTATAPCAQPSKCEQTQAQPKTIPYKRLGRKQKLKLKRLNKHQKEQKQQKPDYQPIIKDNPNFVKFYSQQKSLFVTTDDFNEFEEFYSCIKAALPASFRINTFDIGQAKFLRSLVEGPQFESFLRAPIQTDATAIQPPIQDDQPATGAKPPRPVSTSKPPALEPLEWYPERLAWQLNLSRVDIKKTPILQELHKFLMAETDNGFISRQEAVSMIPPLVLDISRGQTVLDMCAAPGSKTAQLLEYLKRKIGDLQDAPQDSSEYPFDDGLVVANDIDNKRCYMLVHQASRLNSPNCVVINEDAARLPKMYTCAAVSENELTELKFDRILCDVPCSGDGTIRKNPDVWRKWSLASSHNFHGMQSKILKRGLELLKKDGLIVYSTCSMSPSEDESVIANILRQADGSVVLEECSSSLGGLAHRSGLTDWVVMTKNLEVIPNVCEIPEEASHHIVASLFPPDDKEKQSFHLERCVRILPHYQNTGGFFVALLRKLEDKLPWEPPEREPEELGTENPPPPQVATNKDRLKAPDPKKRRFTGFKEDPYIFMEADDADWLSIQKGYELCDNFPVQQLAHRSKSGKKRSIYLVSKATRAFILANKEETGRNHFVKIINGGMRLFQRAETESGFRICQDGVQEILPYVKDDIKVTIYRDDLRALLKTRAVGFSLLSVGQRIMDVIKPGSFILMYEHTLNETSGEKLSVPLVAWRGEKTVSLYVSNTYRVHLCALVQLKLTPEDSITQESAQREAARQDQNQQPIKGEQ